jgi:hypothetical protein
MGLPKPHEPRIKGDRKVIYSWREPADFAAAPITHYKLTVTQEGYEPQIIISGCMTIGHTISGLQPNIPLAATVCASTDGGVTWGPEVAFETITPIATPTQAIPATATATGWGIVTITWTPTEEDYWLYVKTVSENPEDYIRGTSAQSNSGGSLDISDLNPNSVYRFSVALRNPAGSGPTTLTNTVDFTGFSEPVPPPPEEPLPEEEPQPEEEPSSA